MTSFYCTLADAKDEQNITSDPQAAEDARLLQKIRQVSARVDRLYQSKRPIFLPWIEDDRYRAESTRINSLDNTFYFGRNLLALNTVLLGTQALTVGSQVEAWPSGITPYQYLRFLDYTDSWYDSCVSSTPAPLFVTINGTWGYHSNYSEAWMAVDTLTVDPLTGATLTVADVDGTDNYGRAPRISPGALLKIENEYLLVTAVNTGTNVATVKRGVNGTTGVGHAIGSAVSVWQVEDPIRRVVARQSAFLYAREGAYESSSVSDVGITNYPSDLLAELRGALQGYIYT